MNGLTAQKLTVSYLMVKMKQIAMFVTMQPSKSIKLVITAIVSIVFNCLAVSLAGANDNQQLLFRIQGSNTVGAQLVPQCAVDFLKKQAFENVSLIAGAQANEYRVVGQKPTDQGIKKVSIAIAAHGSTTGFEALLGGRADLAMSSRPIKDTEVEALAALGYMRSAASEHTIAIDGLAILVNKTNPLRSLTLQQVALLFAGKITNWQQLGGPDLPVKRYARDDNSGTWDTFKHLVLQKQYTLAGDALRFESNDELSDRVAADPAGIGFTGLASVRNAKAMAIADSGTQALLPTPLTVATEDYPLSRRLFLYTPVNASIEVAQFVSHCQSIQGQNIVTDVGFVSQNIEAVSITPLSHWPQDYRELASSAKRLSVNFRFTQGKSKLDNKAITDLNRVVDYLRQYPKAYKLILVGFADANEKLRIASLISKLRALAVSARLVDSRISVDHYIAAGDFMPVISQDSGQSKIKNARVEIWLQDIPEV